MMRYASERIKTARVRPTAVARQARFRYPIRFTRGVKPMQPLPETIRRFYEAFQRGDMDTLAGLYHDDARLRDPGVAFLLGHADTMAEGKPNILRYYYQAFSNMPEPPKVELKRQWCVGDDVIVENAEGMMTYLEIFTLRDGKIAAQQVFWGSVPPAPLLQAAPPKP
jgi:ketosteroid isomerase-like protein